MGCRWWSGGAGGYIVQGKQPVRSSTKVRKRVPAPSLLLQDKDGTVREHASYVNAQRKSAGGLRYSRDGNSRSSSSRLL